MGGSAKYRCQNIGEHLPGADSPARNELMNLLYLVNNTYHSDLPLGLLTKYLLKQN